MKKHVLLIPADPTKPIEVHESEVDTRALSLLAFGEERWLEGHTFLVDGFQILADDIAALRPGATPNRRASLLAQAHGKYLPLLENIIVIGVDSDGDEDDAPIGVVTEVGGM